MNKHYKMAGIILAYIVVLSIAAINTEAKHSTADKQTRTADYYIIKRATGRNKGEVNAKLQNKKKRIHIPRTVRIHGKQYIVTKISGLNFPDFVDTSPQTDTFKSKKNKKTEEVKLPSSIREIEKATFTNFTKLKNIRVDKKNPYFKTVNGALLSRDGKKLYGVPSVKEIYKVPEGVSVITNRTFAYSSVDTVILPDSCRQIQERAFYKSRVKEVVNLNKVSKIGKYAFYGTEFRDKTN